MKWLFILLLLANVLYLGWEIDRNARLARNDAAAVIRIPPGTPRLQMLSELKAPPAERSDPEQGRPPSAAPALSCGGEIPRIPASGPHPPAGAGPGARDMYCPDS